MTFISILNGNMIWNRSYRSVFARDIVADIDNYENWNDLQVEDESNLFFHKSKE